MTNNDASILSDRKHSENGFGTSEHRLGIETEEKQAGFLIALPAPVIAVGAGGVSELSDDVIEIEIRVNVIGNGARSTNTLVAGRILERASAGGARPDGRGRI